MSASAESSAATAATPLPQSDTSASSRPALSTSSGKTEADKKAPECTVGNICDAYEAMSTLSNEKVDSKASAKMIKIVRWIEPIYDEFVDHRKEMLKKYGVPSADDENRYTVPKDNVPEFVATMNGAAKKPLTFPNRLKLTLSDLEGARVSPAVMLRMRFILADLDD